MVALWVPNAASESLEKNKFVSICLGHLGPEHLVPPTAFPNLILVQNEPPMVALWLPNAASESLEKKKFVSICLGHLGPEHLVPPQLFPI